MSKKETNMQVLEHIKLMIRLRFAGIKNIEADHVNISLYRAWGLSQAIFA